MKQRRTVLSRLLALCMALALVCGMLPVSAAEPAPVKVQAAGDPALLPYQNPALSFEERAADLVSRMTPAEKYSQLTARTASAIPRLGIKAYDWWSEGLHGVARDGEATSFPTGLGIAATWDVDLVERMMNATADEARDKFNSHRNNHGLNYWSPTINMDRDPRWGRVEETYGEDPYLTGHIAEAFINGLQGDNEDGYYKTISTAKHFLANNSEQNRHNGSSNVDERDLREYYTKAFKYAVEEAGVGSIMTSYNAVNGVPMSVNEPIIDDILRRTWGFDGFIVTDCGALNDIVNNHKWRPEGWTGTWNGAATSAYAINAGTDLNCGSVLGSNTATAVNTGLLSEDAVDRALVRLFTARIQTGEFDPDGGPYSGIKSTIQSAENRQLAEDGADNAVVLLQNNDSFLPLKNVDSLVLVGDLADEVILGDYSTDKPQYTSTAVQGISAALKRANPDAGFTYIAGSAGVSAKTYMMNTRTLKLMNAQGTVTQTVAMGESVQQNGCRIEDAGNIGYSSDGCWVRFGAGHLKLDGVSKFSIEMSGDSTNTNVTVLELRAIDPVTGPLLGTVTADILNGWTDYRTYTFDATVGGGYTDQDIYLVLRTKPLTDGFTSAEAETIKNADAVIFFGGTRPGENGFAEERDGSNVDLPNRQADLIRQVASLNPNTAVYIQAVSQANIESFRGEVKSILWSTYNGQAQGNAAGRLLFGESVPSAKLPFTWYTNVAQLNTITDYTMRAEGSGRGRTYRYFTGDVTFPFGYGLSYTTFQYSNLTIDKTAVTPNDTIRVEFDVTNTGAVDAQEVAELYVSSPDASAKGRPAKQLEGFDKKAIKAGETVHFALDLDVSDLWFWDAENDVEVFDQGVYTIAVGPDSAACENMTAQFTLDGQLKSELNVVRAIPSGHILDYAKEGQVITTELTACMSDQTFVDLSAEGVDVSYESSNPRVAAVDENGNVTAVGGGLATITATVILEDEIQSDSFAVAVKQSVLARSIMVDGVELHDFDPETYAYSYGNENADSYPVVSVEADENFDITIKQASGDDSTAVITITSGEITTTYTIRFIQPPRSFDFTKTSLDELRSGWEILNPDESLWTLDEKGLTLITAEGDIYQNNNTYSNLFLQDGYGDWTLEAKINFPEVPTKNYQQAAILAYQDDDNYVKVDYEYCNKAVIQIGSEQNASWTSAGTKDFSGHDLYYRLVKEGNKYTAYYCTDGVSFVQYGSPVVMNLDNIKIGLLAINGDKSTAPSIPATFEYLRIVQADKCSCTLSDLVVETDTELPAFKAGSDPASHSMTASVTATGNCEVEGHADGKPVIIYSLKPDGLNTCGASISGSTLTYSRSGKVEVRVTASWNTAVPIYKDVTYVIPADERPDLPEGYYDFANMTKEELLRDWTIIREAEGKWSLGADGLTITTESGDLYQGNNDCHNLFVRDGSGNWMLEAELNFPKLPSQNYQQASILAYQDDNNYVKLSYEYGGKTYIQIGQEKNGTWSQSGQLAFSGNSLTYRLVKLGNDYTAYYSTDGVNFTQLGKVVTQELKDPKIGLCAINGYNSSANQIPVNFRYLYFEPNTACTCKLSNLAIEGDTVLGSITDGETFTYTIPEPTVTTTTGCVNEGHDEAAPTFTYTVKPGGVNTCGASVKGNVLTATKAGKVELNVTAEWNDAEPLTASVTYTIPRAMRVIEDYDFTKMSKSQLLKDWYIVREAADKWTLNENGLTITSEEGDLYQNNNTSHNLFLHDMDGDWTLESEVEFSAVPAANYQQSSILTYQDDDNYVKLSYEYGGKTYLQIGAESAGKFTNNGQVPFSGTHIQYRLVKVGNTYTAYYSTDGIRYTQIGKTVTQNLNDEKLGLVAINGYNSTAGPLDVTFKYIRILGCDHDYSAVVTAPTCENAGYTTYTCTVCGDTYVGDETPATGHSFSESWTFDEAGHWHVCENEGCDEIADYGEHSYQDFVCVCGCEDVAGAKAAAIAEVNEAAGEDASEAVRAIADAAIEAIGEAADLAELNARKADALEDLADAQRDEAMAQALSDAVEAQKAAEAAQAAAESAQAAAEAAKKAAEAASAEAAADKAAAENAKTAAESAKTAAETAKAAAETAKAAAETAKTAAEAAGTEASTEAVKAAKSAADAASAQAAAALDAAKAAEASAEAAKAQAAAQAAQAAAETAQKAAEEAEAAAGADKTAAEAAKSAAEAAKAAAEAAKKAAEEANAEAALEAANSAEAAAEAANALNAAQAAQAAAEKAQKAAEEAEEAAGADRTAAEAAKAAAELAQSRAEIAQEAAEAAQAASAASDANAAANAAKAAADAALSAECAANAAKAQQAAQIAQARAEAAEANAEAAREKTGDSAAEAANAQEAAEEASKAAQDAKAAAEEASKAAKDNNAEAASASARAAESAAKAAEALAEMAKLNAEFAEKEAAAEKLLEAAKAAELGAAKYYALMKLAQAADGAAPEVVKAGEDAIAAAETPEDVENALAEALAALAAECPSVKFIDAPKKGNWAHEGIDFCISRGYMNGTAETVFSPNDTVTRAQLVTILYRISGSPDVNFTGKFSDVSYGAWYSGAVEWAAANGVVLGVGNGRFDPDGAITREQIATILYRYSKADKVEGDLKSFPDGSTVSAYAVDALVWAVQEGLITGVKSGDVTRLAPKDNATRAQIAAIIMRFLEESYDCK